MLQHDYHSNINNEKWAARQSQQYNAQLLQYQIQHQQHQPTGLGVQGFTPLQFASVSQHNHYHNSSHYSQYHNASNYQLNAYYSSPFGDNASGSQQQYHQPLRSPPMSVSSSGRQTHGFKSPRQQFADTLKRGVQNIAFTPAGVARDTRPQDAHRSMSQMAALPARPDSAIRAAQVSHHGDTGPTNLPMHQTDGQSSRAGIVTSTVNGPAIVAPPRPAPSLPLASRFNLLPPKPPLKDDSTPEEQQLHRDFEAREEALLLRVDALGFQPEAAWEVMREAVDGHELDESAEAESEHRETPAPILGIRLLQRLQLLQKENDELEVSLSQRLKRSDDSVLQDAHRLIDALDEALTKTTKRAEEAEAKVSSLEKALTIACDQRSGPITETSIGRLQAPSSSPPWQRSPLPPAQHN